MNSFNLIDYCVGVFLLNKEFIMLPLDQNIDITASSIVFNAIHSVVNRGKVEKRDPKWMFIRPDGTASDFVISLLKMDGLYDAKDHLSELVTKTQKSWIAVRQGQGNKERTDIRDTEEQQARQVQVEKLIREVGLLDERPPALAHYDHALCPGAFLGGIRSRLAHLLKVWNINNTRYDDLVFLTGERDLRKEEGQEDCMSKLLDLSSTTLPCKQSWKMASTTPYNTEYDMNKLLFEQIQLPESMEKALDGKVHFVNARKGTQNRVDTRGTCHTWKQQKPTPISGTALVSSSPLLWAYQHLTIQNSLGSDFIVDTTAPAVSPVELEARRKGLVGLVQDTVAKCLYEIQQGGFVPVIPTAQKISKKVSTQVEEQKGSLLSSMILRSGKKISHRSEFASLRYTVRR